jgi:2-polyprenyl-3-methyl-5-hydroxy-6-metoxy-1,4-benzoquinol methylase
MLMLLDGTRFRGRLPCLACRYARRRKTEAEWRRFCGECRGLRVDELELLQWYQDNDQHVVVSPNMFRHSRQNATDRYLAAKAAVAASGVVAGARLLDIGCGTSSYAELFREFRYFGADLNRAGLRRGRAMYPWANYSAQNIGALGWSAGAFGVVLCLEVIEHVPPEERLTLLRELLRVLTPDGLLVLSTPNGRLNAWKRVFGRKCERSHYRELASEEVSDLARGAGAQVVSARALSNVILPASRLSAAAIHLVADRPRWREKLGHVTAGAGYQTILYAITRAGRPGGDGGRGSA